MTMYVEVPLVSLRIHADVLLAHMDVHWLRA